MEKALSNRFAPSVIVFFAKSLVSACDSCQDQRIPAKSFIFSVNEIKSCAYIPKRLVLVVTICVLVMFLEYHFFVSLGRKKIGLSCHNNWQHIYHRY